jgi:hypothetical protein
VASVNRQIPVLALVLAGLTTSGCAGSRSTSDGGSGCSDCGQERACCDDHCVNLANDPLNCGQCGRACTGDTYCTGSECVPRPCSSTCTSTEICCGAQCCAAGQLCCDPQGPIETGAQCTEPSETGTCPMGCAPLCKCAAPDTPIATPNGERTIESLAAGDLVYSIDQEAIRAVPIAATNRISVTKHEMVRVHLASGIVLEISGTHPTADGRSFDELHAGDELDSVGVVAVERVPYSFAHTYDILPASSTGTYFAGGVAIGSTLYRGR